MAYGLPTRGQADWDDELNNSINNLRGVAESVERTARQAHDLASYAVREGGFRSNTPFAPDPDNDNALLVVTSPLVAEDPDNPSALLVG